MSGNRRAGSRSTGRLAQVPQAESVLDDGSPQVERLHYVVVLHLMVVTQSGSSAPSSMASE